METALSKVPVFKLFRAKSNTDTVVMPEIVIALDIINPPFPLFPGWQRARRGYIPSLASGRNFPLRYCFNNSLLRSYCHTDYAVSVSPSNLLNSTGRLCSMNDDIDQPMAIREQVNDLRQVKLASTVQE